MSERQDLQTVVDGDIVVKDFIALQQQEITLRQQELSVRRDELEIRREDATNQRDVALASIVAQEKVELKRAAV